MKHLFSSLVSLALLFFGAPARALPTGTLYQASYGSAQAGTLLFSLDSVVPEYACRYAANWMSDDGYASSQCYVDESVELGHEDCEADSLTPMNGLVQVPSNVLCDGFDGDDQQSSIFMMVLGERAEDASLQGVVLFSPSDMWVVAISIDPVG